jgi:CspA family cold shock protein
MAHTGYVRFFDIHKGWGFIEPVTGEADVFVHISAVRQSNCGDIDKGDTVAYEIVTRKKPMAANLRIIAEAR